MDDATKVSIEALKRIRDEAKAGKNPRKPKPKPKPERVMRGEGAVLLEDVRYFLARFVIYPSEHAHDRACSLDRTCASHGRMGEHAKACLSVARAGVGKDAIDGSIGASGSRSGRGRECHAGLSFQEGWRRRRAADNFV